MISKISNMSIRWKIVSGVLSFILLYAASFGITFAALSFINSSQVAQLSPSLLRGKTSDKARAGKILVGPGRQSTSIFWAKHSLTNL